MNTNTITDLKNFVGKLTFKENISATVWSNYGKVRVYFNLGGLYDNGAKLFADFVDGNWTLKCFMQAPGFGSIKQDMMEEVTDFFDAISDNFKKITA